MQKISGKQGQSFQIQNSKQDRMNHSCFNEKAPSLVHMLFPMEEREKRKTKGRGQKRSGFPCSSEGREDYTVKSKSRKAVKKGRR